MRILRQKSFALENVIRPLKNGKWTGRKPRAILIPKDSKGFVGAIRKMQPNTTTMAEIEALGKK